MGANHAKVADSNFRLKQKIAHNIYPEYSPKIFPSQTWKDDFGASLLEYAQGTKKWDDVKKDAVEEWATEKEALQ